MTRHVLLLVAHGSRREASNEEVRQLTGRLGGRIGGEYDAVRCAFLELASPLIPEAIDQAVADGATRITLLPYFLVAGRHVAADIPGIVEQKQRDHPLVELRTARYLGQAEEVLDLLEAIATASAS